MRTLKTRLRLAALATLPLLAACSDPFWTANIREVRSLPIDSALITNADVRTVNRTGGFERVRQIARDSKGEPLKEIKDGKERLVYELVDKPRQFVCAEPSPDVARVVQAALSAGFTGTGNVASPVPAKLSGSDTLAVEAAARLDASRSEAIAQLTRRIATIQLLRDGMYRACEAYTNGAIGKEIYTAIVSRYDKMMVTMLLGEMASGNLPGMATAGGEAASGAAAADPAVASAKAQEARAAARTALEAAIEADRKAKSTLAEKKRASDKVTANDKATDEEKRTAKADLADAENAQTAAEEKLVLARRTSKEADEAASAAAVAARLGAGRTVVSGQARISGATTPAGEVAEVLYRMQREYLNDPQLGTQILICAAEAAQPDPMGSIQHEFCKDIFSAAFKGGGTPSTERARAIQMAELKTQALTRILASLPATTSPGHRVEIIRMIRDMYQ